MSIDRTRPNGRDGSSTRLGPLVLALLLVTAPVPAQAPLDPPAEPEEGTLPGDPVELEPEEAAGEDGDEGGSSFSSSLTLASARDSGFLGPDGERELDDTVHLVRPSLLLAHRPSGRSEFLLGYEPELQFFDEHSELDAVDHAAGALFQHDLTRRSRVFTGGSILDGEDPGRHLSGLLLVLPRVPYRQSRLYAGFEHRWQLSYVLLHLGHSETEIESGTGVFAAGLDQSENTATLTLGRAFGERTDLAASYSYIDPTYETLVLVAEPPVHEEPPIDHPGAGEGEGPVDPETPGEPAPPELVRIDDPIQTASLALGFQASPRLGFHVTGGVLEERDDVSWLAAAEVVRGGDAFAFRLRYDRSLLSLAPAGAPGGAAPVQPLPPTAAVRDTVTHALTASFVARPAERLRWEQFLWGARTDLPAGETLDSVAATSRLVYEVAPRVGTFLEGRYLEQRGSDLLGEQFSRSYVSLGVIVGLIGPRRSWGVREAPEGIRRVLPHRIGVER